MKFKLLLKIDHHHHASRTHKTKKTARGMGHVYTIIIYYTYMYTMIYMYIIQKRRKKEEYKRR
jgi:hypothetical protein